MSSAPRGRGVSHARDVSERLVGRVALVTGAGNGFRAAIPGAWPAAGAARPAPSRSSAAGAERTVARIRELGRRAERIRGDISAWEDVQRMAEQAFSTFGRVDVLVNNVGDMAVKQMSWRELTPEAV